MDDDDREYDLANNHFVYNTDDDENEIDRDLEEKLYAAVFHSNDVSSKNQDALNYNNFTSLSEVVNSLKNCADQSGTSFLNTDERLSYSKQNFDELSSSRTLLSSAEKSDYYNLGVNQTGEISHERLGSKNETLCRKERDAYGDKDISSVKDVAYNQGKESFYSGGKSSEKYMTKKQKNSPRKLNKSRDSRGDYCSLRKSHGVRNEGNDAENESRNHLTVSSVSQDATDSSEVKSAEELEGNKTLEKEETVLSRINQMNKVGGNMDESTDVKPEEESVTVQSDQIDRQIADKTLEDTEVKPEEANNENKEKESCEKSASMRNSSFISSSSNSSSSDSFSQKSFSSSSKRETQISKNVMEQKNQVLPGSASEEIIILDDSEGSVCEVPVPPKPRPPTINLEDSASSTSSEDETSTEVLSAKELVESYRLAVSETSSGAHQAFLPQNSTKQSKRIQSQRVSSSSSDSDDSMTESEEENWGIIAGREINTDQPGPSSSRNLTASEIADESTVDFDLPDNAVQIIENREEKDDNCTRESLNQFYSDLGKKTTEDSSSRNVEEQLGEAERLLQPRETSGENNNKEKDVGGSERNEEVPDVIIINTENSAVSSIEEIRGEVTPKRLSENRKRPLTDSGKKSKHRDSPKKVKTSDDSRGNVTAGSSSGKSPRENKENKNKRRNRATDYFFTPMNEEMDNFYNKSWGGENFDIDEIRRQMPKDQRHWAILNEDLLSYQQRKSRYWTESKCRNCHRTGHNMAECPEKKKVPSCHMCGTPGHREPRCPHKMCLGCGKKQTTYMQVCNGCRRAWCDGCQSYGHLPESCPDHWRQYHATTSHSDVNTYLTAEDVMKPQRMLSCCNCAKRGHDSTTCDNYRWSRHFPTPVYVSNYRTAIPYPEDLDREDGSFPSETRESSESQKRYTDNDVAHSSSSSGDGSKRRPNTAEPEKVTSARSKDVDKRMNESIGDKEREYTKEKSKSSYDKTQKSKGLLPANSRTKDSAEILLTLESPLLNAEFIRTTNFGECIVPLFVNQYEELTNSDLSRTFLLNLTSQFPMKIEIKRFSNRELAMTIASTKDLHKPIQTTIMDWLKWPTNERNRFVSLNLPTKKQDLIELLGRKLNELKRDLGSPYIVNQKIKNLKKELHKLRTLSLNGRKSGTSSHRASVVESLAKAQCRLNMIFFGQAKLRGSDKSCKFLESTYLKMQRFGNEIHICPSLYLLVVHHYNIIFSPHTPDNLNNLLDLYWQRYSKPGARKNDPVGWIAAHANLVQEIRSQHNTRRERPPLILNGPVQILSKNTISPAFDENPRCSGVEDQFVPRTGFNAVNPKPKPPLPTPHLPLIHDLDRLENNYYNSQYDFGANSRYQRNKRAQNNREPEDYIALENRNLQNNHYNVEKDVNNAGGDFRQKLSSLFADEGAENAFRNDLGEKVHGNLLPVRNRWQENSCFPPSQDLFFSDTRTEISQSYVYNDGFGVAASRNDIERRGGGGGGRYDANEGASTSGMRNPIRIYSGNNDPGPSDPEKQRIGSGKNRGKKKKRNKEGTISKSLKRKAKKHIAKYIDCEVPALKQAAQNLERKFNRKNLKTHDVVKLATLANRIKRKLKKNDQSSL